MTQNPDSRETALRELQAALGPGAVLQAHADVAPYLVDWRGRFRGSALAVAQPDSTAGVAAALAWARRHRVPVVPQGGNTGLAGGATPLAGTEALVLSTRRLRKVREVDPGNDAIVVEAGCLLAEVQGAAAAAGRLFPLSLAAEGSCTIGGNLATNAGGTQVLRYGNARELTLGLEVVLADGRTWNGLRALRKDNSGYDLKQLFIGSEGTLGVITAAALRLFPRPRGQAACLAALPGFGAAVALLQRARAMAGPALTAFELMSSACVRLVAQQLPGQRPPFAAEPPWLALMEISSYGAQDDSMQRCEDLCQAALQAGEASDAIVARSLADSAALWSLRESIPEAQARGGGNVKHDVSLPVGAMAGFVEETTAALAVLAPELQVYVFGHLGDGNLHFNVGTASGTPAARAFALEEPINDRVFSAVLRHGGSISAEHGLGQLRRELAERVKAPLERELMRSIKSALDPDGLMNPGKVV